MRGAAGVTECGRPGVAATRGVSCGNADGDRSGPWGGSIGGAFVPPFRSSADAPGPDPTGFADRVADGLPAMFHRADVPHFLRAGRRFPRPDRSPYGVWHADRCRPVTVVAA